MVRRELEHEFRLLKQRKRSAFTLMEIIVVAAIILILAGAGAVVLPRFLSDAKVNRAKMDIKSLETAVMGYQARNQNFPNSLQELAEVQPDGGLAFIDRSLLKDPWNNYYEYNPGQLHPRNGKPLIRSQGPPGQATVPISNWPPD
jgi:general secretion pathway protein G